MHDVRGVEAGSSALLRRLGARTRLHRLGCARSGRDHADRSRVPPSASSESARVHRKLKGVFDFSAARTVSGRGGVIPVGGRVSRFSAPQRAAGRRRRRTGFAAHCGRHSQRLESGWYAGHAIADHLLDGGVDPGRALAARYPSFFWKQLAAAQPRFRSAECSLRLDAVDAAHAPSRAARLFPQARAVVDSGVARDPRTRPSDVASTAIMMIGHLPAGYLLAKGLADRLVASRCDCRLSSARRCSAASSRRRPSLFLLDRSSTTSSPHLLDALSDRLDQLRADMRGLDAAAQRQLCWRRFADLRAERLRAHGARQHRRSHLVAGAVRRSTVLGVHDRARRTSRGGSTSCCTGRSCWRRCC